MAALYPRRPPSYTTAGDTILATLPFFADAEQARAAVDVALLR